MTKTQIIKVKVIPKSSQNKIVGWENDILKIKLMAPPVDGKANEELIKFLAKELKLKKKDLEITSGKTSKFKTIEIAKNISNNEIFLKR